MKLPSVKQGEIAGKAKLYAALLFFALALILFFSVFRASIFSEVSEEKKIWFELSFLLLAAITAEMLVSYLKQPFVMVLLLVGVVISPSAISAAYPFLSGAAGIILSPLGIALPQNPPELVSTGELVMIFAKLGSILLLFKIGLHSETRRIFNLKNMAIALLGVVVPFLGGYLFAIAGGHDFYYAMFLGAALCATSVGVTVAVLEELRIMQSDMAQALLGAAVIDDILALLVLSFVLQSPGGIGADAFVSLAKVAGTAFIFVVGGILLGRFAVLNYFDPMVSGGKGSRRGFLAMLMYLLFYAYVAEYIGLSAIVGAFVAGITMNYSRKVGEVQGMFYPLEALFTPVFFISLGLLVDINALFANLAPIMAITLIAIATKIIGCGAGALAVGVKARDSLAIGVGMIPRGEIALIIGLYGLTALTPEGAPVLGAAEYATIASMAFLTTIIAPAAIQWAARRGG
ncbi:MAG: cation:proton antiporter [Candidatus Micrarchaeia archaeon]|jgi:Kef-type K+ transport system membrane component KefB